jgi:hypothetical protein
VNIVFGFLLFFVGCLFVAFGRRLSPVLAKVEHRLNQRIFGARLGGWLAPSPDTERGRFEAWWRGVVFTLVGLFLACVGLALIFELTGADG